MPITDPFTVVANYGIAKFMFCMIIMIYFVLEYNIKISVIYYIR